MSFPFEALVACRAELEAEASANDPQAVFPTHGLARLRALGVLSAALPLASGGCWPDAAPEAATGLLRLLRLVGQGSLALGRVVEGHVNALRLVIRYGSPAQRASVAADVHEGALLGVWVTDGAHPLHLEQTAQGLILRGQKAFASGAGHVTQALVTARTQAGTTVMLLVGVEQGCVIHPSIGGLSGMRGAGTGQCDFEGLPVTPESLIGQAGDYLRQPEFSAGAWRPMAVALGGIERLTTVLREQLAERERARAPAQQARIGRALIAAQTAMDWTRKAALVATVQDRYEAGDITATVDLARIAVEQAGLEVIELVQRGLGLSAFIKTNVAERLTRDLATYLRQPAPDETLCAAASWFTQRDLPPTEALA
ncbi:acyl-CoA dehydrogenase [Komagataeibacter xylinus]|uniref:Acyl-CoA dehydrogenase n=1 Tax=Komagataeibacter xylinus TaxID=28448 RepID=A0A857FQF1_KOMXY|nr:acyl-CoA dehydrogenase [Komagataeibacter xylinus]QHC36503.1 acyl-CoA dehydrogenase [Komagataeibacter xylinus]